ncbi:aminomethyl-transferring glycine dehydrogenase [Verrucomicrobium sp. BvORR106]|uniref:aminomethyl-transferring glycine dehydrogenase n=1 Tax=Verrucomicrobium sp. BvORR106 TaxID=1403819 RepID=UPI000571F1D3|nr:aminomethyl-transferring glycine dehydrogenase [Verrucomicrobium sp. BvORR106]
MSFVLPFARRHIGPSPAEALEMARSVGCESLDQLIEAVVPEAIRRAESLQLPPPLSEEEALKKLKGVMSANKVVRSFLGLGYHDTFTPPVIQRNIFENPGWYTAYTPYQAEISQGRLEALLNFQTMICDLTGLDVANASLLDEGSAAAEACGLALAGKPSATRVVVSNRCHPHVIDVVRTRMEPLGVTTDVVNVLEFEGAGVKDVAAVVATYPDTLGVIEDLAPVAAQAKAAGALFVVCADLLALTILKPPGEFGADICVGNSQRFGVPLGFGGPHAAFMSVKDVLKRRMPGRLIGVSKDAQGNPGYRLSLQTREQHIRREKATSNICTAQVLLAVMASMYAVWHGPEGLRNIARGVHGAAVWLSTELQAGGLSIAGQNYFDTLTVEVRSAEAVVARALELGLNLRQQDATHVTVALDERVTAKELQQVLLAFGVVPKDEPALDADAPVAFDAAFGRLSTYLTHPVFNAYHTESEMMRYLRRLEAKDIALNRSMIPLGSCTMKLNAAAEMMPLSWPEVSSIHPFVPADQSQGYREMFFGLESWLAECTGFAAVSLQPNAGSQGEYAGLLAIRRYLAAKGELHRDACLIPVSAHGTNPASAVMCGFKVIPVACDENGNVSLEDLRAKVETHADKLGALMITYPSTHGVFEESIKEICALIHEKGGQVYMDGANMNAQVGLTSPGLIGSDVCHLNLHKTFCIPHGGGGPGVGPIGVAAHLVPYLPGHATFPEDQREGAVCSAPWGSASINTISWMYLAMMGSEAVQSTRYAILNANYIARKLAPYFPVLYTGGNGYVAHECILDLRHFKTVTVEDVAKRLIDFGYHAPTMSWPVTGTLMIEPTESESRAELDRFCEAMIEIHGEIESIETGLMDPANNVLKNAPHTADVLLADEWTRPYTRQEAAFPLPWVKADKYWPSVGRVDNVHGDRHLICTCQGMEAYAS